MTENAGIDMSEGDRRSQESTSVSLRNRYSRFLYCFKLDGSAFLDISCKSDQWIMHFIEDCYEDAVQSCDKANESNSDYCADVDGPRLGRISVIAH